MKTIISALGILGLVLSTAACGNKHEKAMSDYKDALCACEDQACATAAAAKMQEAMGDAAKNMENVEMTDKMKTLQTEIAACQAKIATKAMGDAMKETGK